MNAERTYDTAVIGAGVFGAWTAYRLREAGQAVALLDGYGPADSRASDFLIDRHPDFENIWLVGGGSGHGFKHGPALGEYVAGKVTQADTDSEPRFVLSAEGKARRRLVY